MTKQRHHHKRADRTKKRFEYILEPVVASVREQTGSKP